MTSDETRNAADAAGELARMGIDPASIGLPPYLSATPPPPFPEAAQHGPGQPPPAQAGTSAQSGAPAWHQPASGLPFPGAPPAAYQSAMQGRPGPGGLPGTPAGPVAAVRPVLPDQLSHPEDDETIRPVTPAPTPAAARDAVAAFGAGLLTAGSASRAQREQGLVANVRTPQRVPQVVPFLAGKGGVGTTTTAAGVALALASLREDEVVLLDARTGATPLGQWLSGERARVPAGPSAPPAAAPDPASRSVLRLPGGLEVVDGAPWHAPVAPEKLTAMLGSLRRGHAFTLVDLGNEGGGTAQRVLAACTRAVVVTAADRRSVSATALALSRIQQVRPEADCETIVAVVCLNRRQYRRVLRRLSRDLSFEAARIVPVPYDPAIAAIDVLEPGRLRVATRKAFLSVAAALAASGGRS